MNVVSPYPLYNAKNRKRVIPTAWILQPSQRACGWNVNLFPDLLTLLLPLLVFYFLLPQIKIHSLWTLLCNRLSFPNLLCVSVGMRLHWPSLLLLFSDLHLKEVSFILSLFKCKVQSKFRNCKSAQIWKNQIPWILHQSRAGWKLCTVQS